MIIKIDKVDRKQSIVRLTYCDGEINLGTFTKEGLQVLVEEFEYGRLEILEELYGD